MPAIAAKHITVEYDGLQVLNNASFSVDPGERVCIWGPSGSGKSTFLRILAGLEKASEGSVIVQGKAADMDNPRGIDPVRKELGFVFQNSALISNLSVFDNVALPLKYHRLGALDIIEDKVKKALNNMLVGEYATAFPHQLSLGIQKRVAIARTLVLNPSILLMDEPTAGLDHLNRVNLLALLYNVCQLRKVTILMVTHDLEIPRELNAKVSILNHGKLSTPMWLDDLLQTESSFLDEIREDLQLTSSVENGFN